MISFYETFFLEDIDNDFTVAASVVFSLMKKFALDSSFDTMYLSRAEDGAFLGYHNKKDANGSYEMSFLPGWDCPWNYTKACNGSDPCDAAYPGFQPACRHQRRRGPAPGLPACGAWILGKCDVFAFAQGLYNSTCDDAMEVWESDGADSSWSDIYEFHSNGDLGITATRVYADWRGRRTMTASVDYVLSAVDAAVAGATTTGDVAYVMEYRTGLLVAVSEGRRVDADGKRVTPYESDDAAAHGDAVLSVELAAVDMVTPADDDDAGACAAAGCVAPP
ncbi:voltage-gated potassium channel [Aureococcus anophagefferens]|nr:voltage-gated potassium channel [Aureococcus anophagefferens]